MTARFKVLVRLGAGFGGRMRLAQRVRGCLYQGFRRFDPQTFQVIEFSERLKKDMDYYRIVIHQDPQSLRDSFHPQGLDFGPGQGFLHILGQGQHLPPRPTGADDEIIRERAEILHFQEYRVNPLMGDDAPDGQFDQGSCAEGG
jgi:hypothetical protein